MGEAQALRLPGLVLSGAVTLEIYLIRHGDSEINRLQASRPPGRRLLCGRNTYSELTPRGVRQAAALGRTLAAGGLAPADFNRLVASTAVRAQQTARYCVAAMVGSRAPYADFGRIEVAAELAELSQGRLEGQPRGPVQRKLAVLRQTPNRLWTFRAAPDAESQRDVYRRAARWLAHNALGRGYRRLALFTHENVIKCLIAGLFGLSSEEAFRLRVPNAACTILGYRGRRLLAATGPDFHYRK